MIPPSTRATPWCLHRLVKRTAPLGCIAHFSATPPSFPGPPALLGCYTASNNRPTAVTDLSELHVFGHNQIQIDMCGAKCSDLPKVVLRVGVASSHERQNRLPSGIKLIRPSRRPSISIRKAQRENDVTNTERAFRDQIFPSS
jgi:hypothetical protein